MNFSAMSFKVYTAPDHQRYLRDLFYRMARDEELTEQSKGEAEFVIVVMTKAQSEALNERP